MLPSILDSILSIGAILSIFLNLRVFHKLTLSHGTSKPVNFDREESSSLKKLFDPIPEGDDHSPLNNRLSHVIIEVMEESWQKMEEIFKYWQKYPPCRANSTINNWAYSQVTLTILLRTLKLDESLIQRAASLLKELPSEIKYCFNSLEIRRGSGKRHGDRLFFEELVDNKIELYNPSHVLYLGPHCIPLQANWLNSFDDLTRSPSEAFWIIGSIYRGDRKKLTGKTAEYMSINRYALYNFADPVFAEWYSGRVLPYATNVSFPESQMATWELDIFRFMYNVTNSFDFQEVSSKFRLTNYILNLWNTTIDLNAIQSSDPKAMIVCGNVVNKISE